MTFESPTRIKICGITNIDDALQATELGADAIGLVFYAQSPRCVTPLQAQKIIAALPPFITTVGLFVDASAETIAQVLAQVPLDLLQFHGNESPAKCRNNPRPYIKAIRMQPQLDIPTAIASYPDARAILLDAYHPQQAGGTGTVFDWRLVPKNCSKPLILAGGLNPANVAQAIRVVKPYAVDVSSGVEASPGIKDREKLKAFIQEVRDADQAASGH